MLYSYIKFEVLISLVFAALLWLLAAEDILLAQLHFSLSSYKRKVAPSLEPQDVGHEGIATRCREISLPSITIRKQVSDSVFPAPVSTFLALLHFSFLHVCNKFESEYDRE